MSSAAHELEIYSTEKGLTAKQLLAFWKKVEAGPSVLPSSRPLPGKPIAAFNAPYWPTQALQTSQPRSASNVIWSVDHERYGARGSRRTSNFRSSGPLPANQYPDDRPASSAPKDPQGCPGCTIGGLNSRHRTGVESLCLVPPWARR